MRLPLALISLALCLLSPSLFAQVSVNAGGGSVSSTAGSVSFSIGQFAYTIATGSGSAVMGVHHPIMSPVLGLANRESPHIIVYPNPAIRLVNLEVGEHLLDGDHSYILYGMDQRTIRNEPIQSVSTEISIQGLPAGPYVLIVRNGREILKAFTIIKIN